MAKSLLIFILLIFSFLCFPKITYSQSNDDCLSCHSDPDIYMEKNGRKIKLNVKKYEIARSVHSKMLCINCHEGYDPMDIPHKKGNMLVNCMNCHSKPGVRHLWHPSMAKSTGVKGGPDVNCANCHGSHGVKSPRDTSSVMYFTKSTEFCGKCHQDEMKAHQKSEHAFQYKSNNPNSPTCLFCHKNPITEANKLPRIELKKNQEKLCLSCHLHINSLESRFSESLVNYEKSVHGSALLKGNTGAAICIDCHGTHNLQKASKKGSTISQFNVPKVCGKCHTDVTDEYMKSIHGEALSKGNTDAPGCTYCHGEHDIKNVPHIPKQTFSKSGMKFNVVVDNKMIYCVGCHMDKKMMDKYQIATIDKAHEWLPKQSAHWDKVRCVDCHSSYAPPNLTHNILPPSKTVKRCEDCHSMNSILMNTLYRHEKKLSREKYGFINGTILSDAYVIGTTRNVYLNMVSVSIFILTLLAVILHSAIRIFMSIKRKKIRSKV